MRTRLYLEQHCVGSWCSKGKQCIPHKFKCKPIWNILWTFNYDVYLLFLKIKNENQAEFLDDVTLF